MKRNLLFVSVLASLFAAGCSQEEITPDGGNGGSGGGGETNTSYLSVNLRPSDVAGKRVADGYEDGSTAENKVNSVRFYFFTADDEAAGVKPLESGYVNYFDWTPEDGDQTWADENHTDDIESHLKALIVINTENADNLPQKIAAVLNPSEYLLQKGSQSLAQLKAAVGNYAQPDSTKEGTFVMFNSVYGGADNTEVCAVPIKSEHLHKNPSDAQSNPVTIYVERSVAKVRVLLGDDVKAAAATNSMLALKDKEGNELLVPAVTGKQVYLKLSGWDLTAETNYGRLVKAINPAWTYNWWNGGAQAYRSFWAINAKEATNQYHKYSETALNPNFGDGFSLYTNENAADCNAEAPIRRTKVIIKGTLCDKDGNPFTIVRHLGLHFADEPKEAEAESFIKLKKSILNQLKAGGYRYFSESTSSTNKERKELAESDLRIVVVKQTPSEPEDGKARNCYVYAQLIDDNTKTWYASSSKDAQTVAVSVINDNLKNKVDKAMVWNSGMTYYYYEIIHQGSIKGVVRNHIYETTVKKIAGLGTPVYDPEEVIYPEKPGEEDYYIEAEINILSWRLVKGDYSLEW